MSEEKTVRTDIKELALEILRQCATVPTCDGCPLAGRGDCKVGWPPLWDIDELEGE